MGSQNRFSVVLHVDGSKAQTITSPTMAEAAREFREYFVMNCLGASSMKRDCGKLYQTIDGKLVLNNYVGH